jgi:hypothetical protein
MKKKDIHQMIYDQCTIVHKHYKLYTKYKDLFGYHYFVYAKRNDDDTVEFLERGVSILTYHLKFNKEMKKFWN